MDLVRPPAHRHPAPLHQNRWMMALQLVKFADPVGKDQRTGKVGKAVAALQLFNTVDACNEPVRDLRQQLLPLRLGDPWCVGAASLAVMVGQSGRDWTPLWLRTRLLA